MKVLNLEEPELEFGGSQPHVDIRYGLRDYGPLDLLSDLAPKRIRLGLIGTSESIEGLERWLIRCSKGIEAKQSRQPHLFTSFPSIEGKTAFNCQLQTDPSLSRTIGRHELLKIGTLASIEERIKKAVQLFVSEIESRFRKFGQRFRWRICSLAA